MHERSKCSTHKREEGIVINHKVILKYFGWNLKRKTINTVNDSRSCYEKIFAHYLTTPPNALTKTNPEALSE